MHRRRFIQSSALSLLAYPLAKSPYPERRRTSTGVLAVGIIGIGERGQHLMNVIRTDVPEMRIMAYCDLLDERLEMGSKLADKEAERYHDYRKLLDNQEIDAVFIATPLYLHYEMVMAALKAEKHIYCEKTMAHDIDQSLEMLHAIEKSPYIFQVGYQERSSPLFQHIYRLIQNDACGEIMYVDCCWNRNGNWRRAVKDPRLERLINWRMYRAYSGGLMAELCSHQIDIVNWMTQTHPIKARGSAGIDFWKDGRETFDNVTAILDYPGGLKARFTALTTNAIEGFRMKFYGTKATIEVNRENGQQGFIYPEPYPNIDGTTGATQPLSLSESKIPIRVDDSTYLDDSTSRAIIAFLHAILQGTPPPADAESGCASSISVHMANLALENDTVESWLPAYSS